MPSSGKYPSISHILPAQNRCCSAPCFQLPRRKLRNVPEEPWCTREVLAASQSFRAFGRALALVHFVRPPGFMNVSRRHGHHSWFEPGHGLWERLLLMPSAFFMFIYLCYRTRMCRSMLLTDWARTGSWRRRSWSWSCPWPKSGQSLPCIWRFWGELFVCHCLATW